MGTIANLLVAANVDPTGMRRGFDQGIDYTKQFASSVESIIAGTIGGSDAKIVGGLLKSIRGNFEAQSAELSRSLAAGLITPEQFTSQGQAAAERFQKSFTQGLKALDKQDLLSTGVKDQLVARMRTVGVEAGEALNEGIEQATSEGGASSGGGGRGLGGLQRRIQSTAVGIAFASEALFNGQESGARRAARAISLLAFAFDPVAGAITTLVTTGGMAFLDWLKKSEEEVRKFNAETAKMGRGNDLSGVEKSKQMLFSGDPMADIEGKRKGETDAEFQARKLGIEGITRAIADLNAQMKPMPKGTVGSVFAGGTEEQRQVTEFNTKVASQIRDMTAELNKLNAENAKVTSVYDKLMGANNPSDATRADMFRQFDTAKLSASVQMLTSDYKRLADEGQKPSIDMVNQMLAAQTRAKELLDQTVDKTGAQAMALRQVLGTLDGIFKTYTQISTLPPSTMGHPELEGAGQAVTDLSNRLAITNDLKTRGEILGNLARLQDSLKRAVIDEGGALSANVALVNAQKDAEAALLANRTLAGPPKPMPEAFDSIRAEVVRSQTMRDQAAAAKATGAGNAGELEAAANAERQRALGLIRSMLEATDDQTASTVEGRKALEDLLKILNDLGDTTGKNATGFDGMKNAINGVLDAAAGFGKIPQDLKNAATAIEHTIDAVKALKKAQAAASASGGTNTMAEIGSVLGILGGGLGAIGAIGSLFGGGSGDETKSIMRENNDRLRELKLSLDNTLNTASGSRRELTAAQGLQSQFGSMGNAAGILQQIVNGGKFVDQVGNASKALGVSWDELTEKAKELGINLFDDKGRLLVGAFGQLVDALKLEQEKLTQFTNSFDDQQQLAQLTNRVMGKTTPADSYNSTLALLEKFAPALAKGLEGIDATTDDGRKKIESALQALVAQLAAGAISLEQFGDLEGAKQLASIIGMLQDSLDSLSGAVDSATAAVSNVPTWYKVNQARYNAANPMGVPDGAGPSVGTGSIGVSFIPAGSGPVGGGPTDRGLTINGDVNVDARSLSADEILSAVIKAGRRKAALQFGDSSKWSQVQG